MVIAVHAPVCQTCTCSLNDRLTHTNTSKNPSLWEENKQWCHRSLECVVLGFFISGLKKKVILFFLSIERIFACYPCFRRGGRRISKYFTQWGGTCLQPPCLCSCLCIEPTAPGTCNLDCMFTTNGVVYHASGDWGITGNNWTERSRVKKSRVISYGRQCSYWRCRRSASAASSLTETDEPDLRGESLYLESKTCNLFIIYIYNYSMLKNSD